MKKYIKITGLAVAGVIILLIIVSIIPGTKTGVSRNSLTSQNFSLPSPTLERTDIAMQSKELGVESVSMEEDDIQIPTEKKIIKNGNLSLRVDKVDEAVKEVSKIAADNQGGVFSTSFRQLKDSVKSGTITIKVPVADFEKTFSEIKKVASLVLSESTTGQDATEEYVDLQAQLKNKQAEEQSFIKILNQAQKIDDILAVTRELSKVRGQVERLQGRIKYLDSQTDMSTIIINITEDAEITAKDYWRPYQVFKESVNSLIKELQNFVDFIIRFVILIIPVLIIYVIIIWVVYKIGKKLYLKIKNK